MRPLKVVIADTDDLLQRLYADLVSEEPEFAVAECVADRQGLIASLRRIEPELVLLDIYLKDFASEKDLGDLRKKFLRTDYIVLSSGGDPEIVRRTLCQGAFEYLVKPFSFEKLRAALKNYGVYYRSLAGTSQQWRHDDLDSLRSGGREIPKGLQPHYLDVIENFLKDNYDNYSSQEIAEVLGVSGSTARRYLEFLLLSGRVTAEYAYRKVGRPEKRYRIVLF